MSAETAWKVAREAAQKEGLGCLSPTPYLDMSEYERGQDDGILAATNAIIVLPMPPTFAAAVEAEMGEVVEMLVGAREWITAAAHFGDSDAAAFLSRLDALLSRIEEGK